MIPDYIAYYTHRPECVKTLIQAAHTVLQQAETGEIDREEIGHVTAFLDAASFILKLRTDAPFENIEKG